MSFVVCCAWKTHVNCLFQQSSLQVFSSILLEIQPTCDSILRSQLNTFSVICFLFRFAFAAVSPSSFFFFIVFFYFFSFLFLFLFLLFLFLFLSLIVLAILVIGHVFVVFFVFFLFLFLFFVCCFIPPMSLTHLRASQLRRRDRKWVTFTKPTIFVARFALSYRVVSINAYIIIVAR